MKKYLKYYLLDWITLLFKYLQLRLLKTKPILVFTMGKVGSLSIYYALKNDWRTPVFHVHSLSEAEQKFYEEECFKRGILPGSRSAIPMINSQILKKKRPYKIITLVRNPIDRNLSAFFEAFEYYIGTTAEKYQGSMAELEQKFYELLPHTYATDWFQDYFYQQTGVNIYDFGYDKAKKYQLISAQNIEILVMDVALDDSIKEKLVVDFTHRQLVSIDRKNVRESTAAADLYKEFKSSIRFGKNYLSGLLETQYFNHFFDEDSKLKTLQKWQNSIDS